MLKKAASPSASLLLSVCPRNSSVRRRRWCSDTDLEEKPHYCCHIAFCCVALCISTFLIYIHITVRVCGISTRVLTPKRGQDLGRWGLSFRGRMRKGKGGEDLGCVRRAASGLSRVVEPSGDCCSLWWCLASYNLQDAHPFAEVWWMGGGGVQWKGVGDGRL